MKVESFDQSKIKKVVCNNKLGYAIVYYHPVLPGEVKVPKSEDICDRRRCRELEECDNVEEKFHEEIEAMVRRREREDASKEILKMCEKIHDMYAEVQEQELKCRDILNPRVRTMIKGKSADDICKILVDDVLSHSKIIYQPKTFDDTYPHKLKFRMMKASIDGKNEARLYPQRIQPTEDSDSDDEEEQKNIIKKVEQTLKQDIQSEVYGRQYLRAIDRIHDDVTRLKKLCTKKLDFH
jgi:hypothetical protein